jgi:hypothetical protein
LEDSVRTGAGFHADHARRQLRNQQQKLLSGYFWLDQRRLAVIINAMHGKDVQRRFWPDRFLQ